MRETRPARTAQDRLVIALDVPTLEDARSLVDRLGPEVHWFKVGAELFTAAGPAAVALVLEREARVFLDLKFHDIPNSVRGAVASALRLGVSMLTVHAAGGAAMLKAAAEARGLARGDGPVLLGVTVLTSQHDALERIIASARDVQAVGLDGVVASMHEARPIKETCGPGFIVVTPGIRPAGRAGDDQRRTALPGEAVAAGADFVVVGRPITRAADPLQAARDTLMEMDRALNPAL